MSILKIALPLPLRQLFDYLPPVEIAAHSLSVGMRLRVPFGRQKTYVGMVLALSETSSVPADKLKAALTLLDSTPILSTELLQLLRWSSDYYHHPIGEVIAAALPALLRQGQPAQLSSVTQWRLTERGAQAVLPSNAHRQRAILSLLQQHPEGLTQSELKTHMASISKAHLNTLVDKGWLQVESRRPQLSVPQPPASTTLILNPQQQQAIEQIQHHRQQFYPCLLAGVTGSGKTEVYLHSIQMVLAHNQQALVLVPEINLTPQMIQRFQQRLPAPLVVIHSRLTDKERLQAWLYAQSGEAAIIIGTRSAVWTPWVRPGIIIVDEEHDPSYKQQEHYRYSARDVAVRRAQQLQIPIILGSATPSLESFYNAQQGRYHYLSLPERAGNAVHPQIHVVDMRTQKPQTRLSTQLIAAIKHNLAQHQQTLLFINRRGYAPVLMCYQCGWIAQCHQCDARLTYHEAQNELHCHHCGLKRRLESCCPQCQQPQLNLLGQGTQRIEATLKHSFPTARIARIDRDSTQGDVHSWLTHMHQGEIDILVGTQMLAKGHHFPQVTLVGIINMDSSLYSIDFRASERMAQLF
ncbi:MAG: primosomal protein N', partial [Pseudomonadota bacterium]|nr:primosomal protein N' [Pseudomonadota bacterium]